MPSLPVTLGFLVAGYLGILLTADIYLLGVHLLNARRRLLREARELSTTALPPRPALPSVCIQIPAHDEQAAIAHAIDAACAQDWPLDILEIQILNDGSVDDTARVARIKVATWASRGVNVHLLDRVDRSDFKAGVLKFGFERTAATFVAVFDADYRPRPTVLKDLMRIMLSDDRLAFVQARLDYRNRNTNWLTRAQATELDMVGAFEHAARNWGGLPLPFLGTCAVWRREAITEAGGWNGRSLSEDLDLSLRALALGWRSRFLNAVSVEGELPENFRALFLQRSRWGTGISQQFRFWPWHLHRRLRWHSSVIFLLLSQFHAFIRPGLAALALCAGWAAATDAPDWPAGLAALLGIISALILSRSLGAVRAMSALGRKLDLSTVGDLVRMWLLQAALLPIGAWSAIKGLFDRAAEFKRTPKAGR